jgi:hypothetical protein
MTTPGPLVTVGRVADALNALDVPFLVGGSLASAVQGVPRATNDADIVADLKPEDVVPLVRALRADFYLDPDTVRHEVARQGSFNLIDLATYFKVDIFVAGDDPFRQTQLARSRALQLDPDDDRLYPVAGADDIVLAKLDWYRKGGEVSDRQWSDVQGVLKSASGRLDKAYLRQWAAELGVSDLLERALIDAGSA